MNKIIFALILSVLVCSMIFGMIEFAIAENGNGNQGNNSGSSNRSQVGAGDNETGNGTVVTVNKTRIEKENLTFIPWQKRNESECPIGCKCVGAVVSCTTADGKVMTIEAGRSGNIITITVDGKEADTNLTIESEVDDNNKTKIKAVLSNDKRAEIKIMPDTASEKAIARLGELGFTIELKEVGKGENAQLVYELKGNKRGKFLGIFKIMASERVQVDAETGEVKKVIKPWWSFLATDI